MPILYSGQLFYIINKAHQSIDWTCGQKIKIKIKMEGAGKKNNSINNQKNVIAAKIDFPLQLHLEKPARELLSVLAQNIKMTREIALTSCASAQCAKFVLSREK